jgi:hypothetical protein
MRCVIERRYLYVIILLLPAIVTVIGCCNPFGRERKTCNDAAPGAIPQPNGTFACQWNHAQVARAAQDRFVIYQYEWAADGVVLTQTGKEHMTQLAAELPQNASPIIIEPSLDVNTDAARRRAVFAGLANAGCQISEDRIFLGRSEAEGLYGSEASGIAHGMLGTQSGQKSGSASSQSGTQSSLGSGVGVNVNVGSGSR